MEIRTLKFSGNVCNNAAENVDEVENGLWHFTTHLGFIWNQGKIIETPSQNEIWMFGKTYTRVPLSKKSGFLFLLNNIYSSISILSAAK